MYSNWHCSSDECVRRTVSKLILHTMQHNHVCNLTNLTFYSWMHTSENELGCKFSGKFIFINLMCINCVCSTPSISAYFHNGLISSEQLWIGINFGIGLFHVCFAHQNLFPLSVPKHSFLLDAPTFTVTKDLNWLDIESIVLLLLIVASTSSGRRPPKRVSEKAGSVWKKSLMAKWLPSAEAFHATGITKWHISYWWQC